MSSGATERPCGDSRAPATRVRARAIHSGAEQYPHPAHHRDISDLDRHPLRRARGRHPRSHLVRRQVTQPHRNLIAGGACQSSTSEEYQRDDGCAPITATAAASTPEQESPRKRITGGPNP